MNRKPKLNWSFARGMMGSHSDIVFLRMPPAITKLQMRLPDLNLQKLEKHGLNLTIVSQSILLDMSVILRMEPLLGNHLLKLKDGALPVYFRLQMPGFYLSLI